MAFLIYGHPDSHGNQPVLISWDGTTAVFADVGMALSSKVAPIEFATDADALAITSKFAAKCRIVDSTLTKDGSGTVTTIQQKDGTAVIDPPPKISKVDGNISGTK